MLRKRYYILFVARDEDGRVRKIPLPLHYAYGFVAAALVGAFTIVGLAGLLHPHAAEDRELSTRCAQERETLRKNYKQMAQIAHDRDVQVASLGALANEVTALYGLRQNKLARVQAGSHRQRSRGAPTPASLAQTDESEPAANYRLDRSSFTRCATRLSRAGFRGLSKAGFRPTLPATGEHWPTRHRCGRWKAA